MDVHSEKPGAEQVPDKEEEKVGCQPQAGAVRRMQRGVDECWRWVEEANPSLLQAAAAAKE